MRHLTSLAIFTLTALATVSIGAAIAYRDADTDTAVETASTCPEMSDLCQDDLREFCSDARTKIEITRCLLDEHGDEISTECKDALECRRDLNQELMRTCALDIGEHCPGVEPMPGRDTLVSCLLENRAELSEECLEVVLEHQAARR